MPEDLEPRYTLTELADLAGVTPRTVRYYISQGLLAVDVASGPGPKYDDAHLARLRVIRRLQREHQPLAEIRQRLATLDDDEILQIAEAEPTPEPTDSALEYIRRVTGDPRRVAEYRPLYQRAAPEALASAPMPSMPAPTAPAAPASDDAQASRLERSQWERIDLAPDVELHVRRPLPRTTSRQVDRLISIARDLLREESK